MSDMMRVFELSLSTGLTVAQDLNDKKYDLNIMWFQETFFDFPNIGVTTLPGCRYKELERNLVTDVEGIVQKKVTDIFCLITASEMRKFRVPELLPMYKKYNLQVHHHPCEDGGLFSVPELIAIIEKLQQTIEDGGSPLLHCVAGKGRSCLVLAAYLMAKHSPAMTPMKVIETVQSFRTGSVFSVKQYNFLMDFPGLLDKYRKNPSSLSLTCSLQTQETDSDSTVLPEPQSKREHRVM